MIREITESEVRTDFLALMSEIEAGSWFDMDNPRHVQWLERTISPGGQHATTKQGYLAGV